MRNRRLKIINNLSLNLNSTTQGCPRARTTHCFVLEKTVTPIKNIPGGLIERNSYIIDHIICNIIILCIYVHLYIMYIHTKYIYTLVDHIYMYIYFFYCTEMNDFNNTNKSNRWSNKCYEQDTTTRVPDIL